MSSPLYQWLSTTMFGLPKTVIILGLVSFLNDTASEMITPLLPLFLTATLGAGPAVVGFIEGIAEATASLLKLASGRLVDRGWNHKRLVLGGYSGFHRALDNAGAMVGPLLAFGLLSAGLPLQHVFLWSLIPGLLVLALLIWGLDGTALPVVNTDRSPLRWSMLDRRVRSLILAAGGLALASAPEAFLVLWANDRGLAIAWVPLVWAGASAVKAIVAGPAGALSDHFGRVPLLLAGWGLRITLLIALAFTAHGQGETLTWTLFLLYGGALAMTEGVERALIGDFSHASQRGTAFGLYHMTTGLAALPGALLFGVLWQGFGAATAFVVAAIIAALSTFMLLHSTRSI